MTPFKPVRLWEEPGCKNVVPELSASHRWWKENNPEHFTLNTSAGDIKCYTIDLFHAVESTQRDLFIA